MSRTVPVLVPDIGDFEDVEVVEILVAAGDRVEPETSLISIESDKATLEVPSPAAGVVGEIHVALGDRVSAGTPILDLETEAQAETEGAAQAEAQSDAAEAGEPAAAAPESGATAEAGEARPGESTDEPPPAATGSPGSGETAARAAAPGDGGEPTESADSRRGGAPPPSSSPADAHYDVVVLGGGPGGYTAAFRAADLGKRVALIERYASLGGVCLNVGCIPSKALLHTAEVMNDARELARHGVEFGEPRVDLDKLREWKDGVVRRLTRGLASLAQKRQVEHLVGEGRFTAPDRIEVVEPDGTRVLGFDAAIVAAGSRSVELPGLPGDDPRVLDSTSALGLPAAGGRLLIIGGGIIGLEMACIYDALGAKVSVVELTDELVPGCDRDLVEPLRRRIGRRYEGIFLSTRVVAVEPESAGLRVRFEGPEAPEEDVFDRVLVAVGRRPNADRIGAAAAGIELDERGFVRVDAEMRTSAAGIFAVGDIVGPPMLAHKAVHEGRTAAEVIAGLPAAFDRRGIPSVAYTDPEIAWVGLTEAEAEAEGIATEKGSFPWSASGRALANGRAEGLTKVLVDPDSRRLLGAGVVGRNAGELISEAVLALEMGADAEDLGLTIHPHPTLSETVAFAAEMVEGTITDLLPPARRASDS